MTSPSKGTGGTAGKGGPLPLAALLLLGGLYLLSRVGSLELLPMFLDEAVHIQWAERLYSEGRIGRPVGAGRLLAVAAYGGATHFDDRLLAARLIAVGAGAVTLFFTVLLSGRLFGPRASVVAGFLYILSPFALVYDRLALSDGFLSASLTGLMFATWKLIHEPANRSARALVVVLIVASVLSKVSAMVFFAALPLAFLGLASDRSKAFRSAAPAFAIGLACASPMLGFFVTNGGEISSQHLGNPFAEGLLLSTLSDMREWVLCYFTPLVLLFAVASLVLLRDGRSAWLAGSVVIPFALFALFAKPWSARYVLPTLPPLLILVSGGVEALAARTRPRVRLPLMLSVATLVSLSSLSFSRHLVTDPTLAPFPSDDRHQLVSGWPSGYGVRELSVRLRLEAEEGPFTAFVDTGGTRTVGTSLGILLGQEPSIRLEEGDFGSAEFRSRMALAAAGGRVFAILGPRFSDLPFLSVMEGATVDRVAVYERPGGEWAATLFRLTVSSAAPEEGADSVDRPLFQGLPIRL